MYKQFLSLAYVIMYSPQDWLVIEEEDEEVKVEGTVDDMSVNKRSAAFSPDLPNDSMLRHRRRIGSMRRSSSNPNLLSCAMDLDCDAILDPLPRVTSPDDVTRQRCSRPRSQSLVAFSLANNRRKTAAMNASTQVTNGHSTSPESDENQQMKSGSFISVFAKKKKEKKLNGKKSHNNLARSNSDVGTPNENVPRTPRPPQSPKTPSKGIWKKAKNYIGGLKDSSYRKTGLSDGEADNKPLAEENVQENSVVMQLEYSPVDNVEWKSVERTIPDGQNQRGYLFMAERPIGGSTKCQWNNVVCMKLIV